jgi:hypothetical protein
MSADIPVVDPDAPWESPARRAVVDPEREISWRERLVRQAIHDPGIFTARGYAKDAPEPGSAGAVAVYEELWQWQARAVLIALDAHA